jgi:hypothetical protein
VSESSEPTSREAEEQQDLQDGDDALPVLAASVSVLQPSTAGTEGMLERPGAVSSAVQAAAVAAGGFVAGAAVVGLVHRRQRRVALAKGRRARRLGGSRAASGRASGRAVELVQIVGSRSLLLDVHLLGDPHDR